MKNSIHYLFLLNGERINMTAKEHNRTIGILFLVYLGLQIFGVIVLGICALMFGGLAIAELDGGEAAPFAIFGIVIVVSLIISVALLIPVAIGGWKLFKEKQNAKTWGIVASIVAMLNFPLGMALGIYGLWFLLGDQGKEIYSGNNPGNLSAYNPPPPPNSWQ